MAGQTETKSFIQKRVGLFLRVKFFFQIWLTKFLVASFLKVSRIAKASQIKKSLPDYTKRYPVRPTLQHRVFLPPGADEPGRKFPLFITIHGGGFVLCDPQFDDEFNRHFSSVHGFLVVSVNYRLAPRNPFPGPIHDCAEVVRAILADTTLPVDHSNVILGGFSAGGGLTLSIAQLPGIKDKVRSLVPFYPATDFTAQTRGPFRTTKDGKKDLLEDMAPLFDWGYISPGTDLADPLLSTTLAGRERLPHRIFFIGAEYDMLVQEAEITAKRLAGVDETQDLGFDWEKNGIKWKTFPGVQHAWNQIEEKGEKEVERRKGLDILYKEIADWLRL